MESMPGIASPAPRFPAICYTLSPMSGHCQPQASQSRARTHNHTDLSPPLEGLFLG